MFIHMFMVMHTISWEQNGLRQIFNVMSSLHVLDNLPLHLVQISSEGKWYGFVGVVDGLNTGDAIHIWFTILKLLIHRLTPAVGSSRTMGGSSCKKIKEQLTGICSEPLSSGLTGVELYC